MARILAVSDIHGLSDQLLRLLEFAKYDHASDELHLLGDYLDRDEVRDNRALATVNELVHHGATALIGNTEYEWMQSNPPGGEHDRWHALLISLPYFHLQPPYLFVHAGIRPGVNLPEQELSDLVYIREPFLDPKFIPEHTVVFGHTPTFKIGKAGQVYVAARKIGIDTGAKHGHRMTLLDLSDRMTYSCAIGAGSKPGDFKKKRLSGLKKVHRAR